VEDVLDRVDVDLLLGGRFVLWAGDHALLVHLPEHVAAAGPSALGIEEGGILAGGLWQPGDERHLGQGQVAHILVEVVLGSGLHPVAVVPQVHPVQVEVEDLLFVERLLQAQGEDGLPDLPFHPGLSAALGGLGEPFGRDEERLGGLLGQGRAALDASRAS
jgi:hypothetical protein